MPLGIHLVHAFKCTPPEVGVKGNDTKSQNTLDVAWGHQMWGGYARYSVETLAFVINDFKN